MSFSSCWSDSAVSATEETQAIQLSDLMGLELLLLTTILGIRRVDDFDLTFRDLTDRLRTPQLGRGAVSSVHLQDLHGRIVAVKHPRDIITSMKTHSDTFEQYIREVVSEVRVLANDRLRSHPNIVALYGYSFGSKNKPLASLVYEYSKWGTMDSFLASMSPVPAYVKTTLCLAVARGLNALHTSYVCHGDIKAANVLVFAEEGQYGWTAKLSDFGQAIIGDSDNLDARVRCSPGTPLFSAPEILRGQASLNEIFTIRSALKADVYSFGLLSWQVLADGQHHLQVYLASEHAAMNDTIDSVLGTFSPRSIISTVQDLLRERLSSLSIQSREIFHTIAAASLKDNPDDRKSMEWILNKIDYPIDVCPEVSCIASTPTGPKCQLAAGLEEWHRAALARYDSTPKLSPRTHRSEEHDKSWWKHWERWSRKSPTTPVPFGSNPLTSNVLSILNHSLIEIENLLILQKTTLDDFPDIVKQMVVAELNRLVEHSNHDNKIERTKAANAAMLIAECWAVGFGVPHSTDNMIAWVSRAAELGSSRATLWLPRIEFAFQRHRGASSLYDLQGSLDLPSLIRANIRTQQNSARILSGLVYASGTGQTPVETCHRRPFLHLETFVEGDVDVLGPLHYSAWLGDRLTLAALIERGTNIDLFTPRGRTVVHYACLAGDLETLRLLLTHNANPSISDEQGVTPLHLCIMFDEPNVEGAFKLLVEHDARLDAESYNEIHWRLYDLTLAGRPLHWAIQTRNSRLVKLYLDAGSPPLGLDIAIRGFFPEIVDILMNRIARSDQDRLVSPIDLLTHTLHPFRHWLFHGVERLSCISDTIDVLERYGFGFADFTSYGERNKDGHFDDLDAHPILCEFIGSARIEEDLHLVYEYIHRVKDVRDYWKRNFDPVKVAISRSEHSCGYVDLLRRLIERCTVDDLNQHRAGGETYLHMALASGPVIATRILLEHGADPNLRTGITELSPLHCSMGIANSPEIFRLLLQFGADATEINSLDLAENVGGSIINLYDTFLDSAASKDTILNTLRELVFLVSLDREERGRRRLAVLKYLLCHDRVTPYLNERFDNGLSLIHYSAMAGSLGVLDLLLEAGVQPDVSSTGDKGEFTALHIALWAARAEEYHLRVEKSPEKEPNYNIPVMYRLLESYHDIQSQWFDGITPLHLAYYIRSPEEIKRLQVSGVADSNARGRWPTNGDMITPQQLYHQFKGQADPYVIEFSSRDLHRLQMAQD